MFVSCSLFLYVSRFRAKLTEVSFVSVQRKIRFRYLPPSRHRIMPVRVLENVAVSQTVLGNYPFILIVHHFSSCCKLSKKLKLLLHFVFFSDFWLVGMFGFYLILTLCVLLFLNAAVEFFMYFLMVSV